MPALILEPLLPSLFDVGTRGMHELLMAYPSMCCCWLLWPIIGSVKDIIRSEFCSRIIVPYVIRRLVYFVGNHRYLYNEQSLFVTSHALRYQHAVHA